MSGRRAEHERRQWLHDRIHQAADGQGLVPGPQAEALFGELIDVFAAGAWLATVILAHAVLEAEFADPDSAEGAVLNRIRHGRDYAWLRRRRNGLLHADGPGPVVTAAGRLRDREELERDARRAVTLVIRALAA